MRDSVFFTQQAELALTNIQYNQVKKCGLSPAREQSAKFRESLSLLAYHSNAGYPVEEVMPGIRYLPCQAYVIFYIEGSTQQKKLILDIVLQCDISEISIGQS